jgi:hypothetical protein
MKKKIQFDKIYTLEEGSKRFSKLLLEYGKLYKPKSLTDAQASVLSNDVRELLRTLQARIEYWEQRRGFFLQLALGMEAFSIAILTAIAAVFDKLMIHPITFITMGVVFAVSIAILIGGIQIIRIWNRQNNPDYPFIKGYKHWRWQYRYAEEIIPEFKYRYDSKGEYEKDIETYIKNLHSYAEKTLKLKPLEILEQDISQLFLLIENEKYKIKFVSELRDEVARLLFVALCVGLAALIVCVVLVCVGVYDIISVSFIKETAAPNQIP